MKCDQATEDRINRMLATGEAVETNRPEPAEDVSERDFQAEVVKRAKALGWMTYHTFDSRRSDPGFPDLVLVRDRVVFAELKRMTGKLSVVQMCWIESLRAANAECYCWTPDQWPAIEAVLMKGAA